MKPTALIVLLVVGLGLGYCWHRGEIRDAIASAETRRTQDSITIEQAWQDSVHAIRDSARVAWVADSSRWSADRTRLARQSARLADSIPSLLSALDALALPDTSRAVVTAAVRGLAHQVELCQAELVVTDSLWTGCQARLASADSTVTELRDLSAARQALVERLSRQARPGFFTRIRQGLPWLGVGVLAGVVLTR